MNLDAADFKKYLSYSLYSRKQILLDELAIGIQWRDGQFIGEMVVLNGQFLQYSKFSS